MSVSKRLASVHEAGHAVLAYYIRKSSISAATITLEMIGNRWQGSTGVNLDVNNGGIPENWHVDIALAGLMAEARFNGFEHPAAAGTAYLLDQQPELAQTLLDYYGLEQNEDNQQTLEETQVVVVIEDGTNLPIPASVSFADLNNIPEPDRNVQQITQAIARLSTFFNYEEHWFRVGLLAEDLDNHEWPTHYDYISFLRATFLTA